MLNALSGYGKILQLGEATRMGLFDGPVVVEEKLDGSQFSFGLFGGSLLVRSKGRCFDIDGPDALFAPACETVKALKGLLHEDYIYRAETLCRPKHNVLLYARVPNGNLSLFDISVGPNLCLSREEKVNEAARLGLDVVPAYEYDPVVDVLPWLDGVLKTKSYLGGTLIEGVVVKNYGKQGPFGGWLMGKFVSERFKEVHASHEYGAAKRGDVLARLVAQFGTQARWDKAVMHLREGGKLTDSPRDIPALIKEVQVDLLGECGEEIREILFNLYWKDLSRLVIRGLPEFYKRRLVQEAE